jgi:hypothetical protein
VRGDWGQFLITGRDTRQPPPPHFIQGRIQDFKLEGAPTFACSRQKEKKEEKKLNKKKIKRINKQTNK